MEWILVIGLIIVGLFVTSIYPQNARLLGVIFGSLITVVGGASGIYFHEIPAMSAQRIAFLPVTLFEWPYAISLMAGPWIGVVGTVVMLVINAVLYALFFVSIARKKYILLSAFFAYFVIMTFSQDILWS